MEHADKQIVRHIGKNIFGIGVPFGNGQNVQDMILEAVHGTLNRIMQVLGVPVDLSGEGADPNAYYWKESKEKTFFPDRQATVWFKGQQIGVFGVVHPEVLKAFDIVYPCSALEINIEPFCYDQFGNSLV